MCNSLIVSNQIWFDLEFIEDCFFSAQFHIFTKFISKIRYAIVSNSVDFIEVNRKMAPNSIE